MNKKFINFNKLINKQNATKQEPRDRSPAGDLRTSFAGGVTFPIMIVLLIISALVSYSNNISNVSAATLSLNISSSTISTDILGSGSYSDGTSKFVESASSTITAYTDNATGYTLSIAATDTTNPTKLIDSNNNDTSTNYLESISTATSATNLSNGTYTPSHNGEWGYKPSQYYDTSTGNLITNTGNNSVFLPSPNTTGDIIGITNAPNTNNTSDTYTISTTSI